jgi:hypothetical protein
MTRSVLGQDDVRDRGLYLDLPLDEILGAFAELYGGRGVIRAHDDDAFRA